jgi:lantibiotic modifying enzyme
MHPNKEIVLQEAINIGYEILEVASIDKNGIFWSSTKKIHDSAMIEPTVNATIYSGSSGIMLFYLELYKRTNDKYYIEVIEKIANWTINHCIDIVADHGFYKGRMGTVYSLLQLGDTLDRNFYCQKAEEIALLATQALQFQDANFDFNEGLTGTIYGLVHLHSKTGSPWTGLVKLICPTNPVF